jgi:hypothetical protein
MERGRFPGAQPYTALPGGLSISSSGA